MRIVQIAFVSLAIAFTVACGKDPQPGELATIADVCSAKYDPAPDGTLKRVTVEGYLDIPRGLFTMCSDTCGMVLKANAADTEGLRVNLKVGGSKNQMKKLPEKYSEKDLAVTTSDGKTVGAGTKVRVTGGRLGDSKSCQIYNVDLIQGV